MNANNSDSSRGAWRLVAVAAIALAVAPLAASTGRASQPGQGRLVDPSTTAVDLAAVTRLTADVSIRRSRVGADGQVRQEARPVTYRIERRRATHGWESTMTRVARGRPAVRVAGGEMPLDLQQAVSRIEDAGDGTPARVFNARGVEVRLPSRGQVRALMTGEAGALRRLGLPEPATDESPEVGTKAVPAGDPLLGLLQDARGRAARRAAIGRRLGAPQERVQGLDRHVVRSGDDTIETLVDPATAVPVEEVVVRDGAVVERVRHAFVAAPRGGLVRRGLRGERVLPGEGERLVIDVEFSGVRVEVGGGR